MVLYDTLLRNGSITVRNPGNGGVFTIVTGKDYGLRWYTVKVNGRTVRNYRKRLYEKQTVLDWLANLEEVVACG